MALFSARFIYIGLTIVIIVLFGATGAYYLLDLSNNPEITRLLNRQKTDDPQEAQIVAQATPTNLPSPTIQTTLTACAQTCEFSFQCEGELQCLENNGTKLCVNPDCPQQSNCICDQNGLAEASNSAILVELAQQNIETGVGGIALPTVSPSPSSRPSPKPTVKSSPTPTPTTTPAEIYAVSEDETYDPQLPDAGTPHITILLLLIAFLSSSLGLLKLRKTS